MTDAPLHPRARRLVEELGLVRHPEGGWYAEVYRSTASVTADTLDGPRPFLTTIYFLVAQGESSRWHRLRADEVWHWYEGDPLDLLTVREGERQVKRQRLGLMAGGAAPVVVVPAGTWQAARSTGAYTLVGCTVGPGFTFADFTPARKDPNAAVWIADLGEEARALL